MNNPSVTSQRKAYWKANLKLVSVCLVIWFTVSYVFSILLVHSLNEFRLFGFKLGFWFAQQGSIYVYLLLIFFYAWRMNKLDREFHVHEEEIAPVEQTTVEHTPGEQTLNKQSPGENA